MHIVKDQMI